MHERFTSVTHTMKTSEAVSSVTTRQKPALVSDSPERGCM